MPELRRTAPLLGQRVTIRKLDLLTWASDGAYQVQGRPRGVAAPLSFIPNFSGPIRPVAAGWSRQGTERRLRLIPCRCLRLPGAGRISARERFLAGSGSRPARQRWRLPVLARGAYRDGSRRRGLALTSGPPGRYP